MVCVVDDEATGWVGVLRQRGVGLAPGLSDEELDQVERTFDFVFSPDHRRFLAAGLPLGDRWVDWRTTPAEELRGRLSWPIDGILFDVQNNDFWPASWGPRPAQPTAAEAVARQQLAFVPRLIPIYSHRYLPAAPAMAGCPVYSVVQADVIYYGTNLLDYLRREFAQPRRGEISVEPGHRIAFWSNLAEGADSTDL